MSVSVSDGVSVSMCQNVDVALCVNSAAALRAFYLPFSRTQTQTHLLAHSEFSLFFSTSASSEVIGALNSRAQTAFWCAIQIMMPHVLMGSFASNSPGDWKRNAARQTHGDSCIRHVERARHSGPVARQVAHTPRDDFSIEPIALHPIPNHTPRWLR